MGNNETRKSNRIISFDKLTDELKEQFAEAYPQPDGYEPYLRKIIKPDGTPLFVVPFETPDTSYMVKFEVKIDSHLAEDELEKDIFGDSSKNGEMSEMDIIEQNERGEKDDSHREFTLNHGDYEKAYAEEAAMADASTDNAFNDDDLDEDDDLLDDNDDVLEPDEEELLDIELELMESEKTSEKETKKAKKSSAKKVATSTKKTKTEKAEQKSTKRTVAKATKEREKKTKHEAKESKKK